VAKKKKKRSLASKVFNNRAMRILSLYEFGELMASPTSEAMVKLLGMQEGGQIKKKRKKKPIGWGKARYGK
tara:strand:+ start:18 stop:230 length:213 start_codon:yes stop_codon:yes gene_type:complete